MKTVYSEEEMNNLRKACQDRFDYGTCAPSLTYLRIGKPYQPEQRHKEVEKALQTQVAAGRTAAELILEDTLKRTEKTSK